MIPTVYMLVGVPGSGKSTWLKEQKIDDLCVIASTDSIIELAAEEQGKTYNDVFADLIDPATKFMMETIRWGCSQGYDVYWDQTNLTAKGRKKKLGQLPPYRRIAIVFPTPDKATLKTRLASRPGKNIPYPVMQNMLSNFEMPTLEEGFDEIRIIE